MIRFDTRESAILWPSSITLVILLQDNERNAESKEITEITYQSATITISSAFSRNHHDSLFSVLQVSENDQVNVFFNSDNNYDRIDRTGGSIS